MKYTLIISADPDDADYIQLISTIDEKTLKRLISMYEVIKEKGWWGTGTKYKEEVAEDCGFSEDEMEFFDTHTSYGDYTGCHTIQYFKYAPEVKWEFV